MTENETVLRVKEPPTISLVDRDSATRRARRLAVESDVGELLYICSRGATQALFFMAPGVLWLACTGSLNEAIFASAPAAQMPAECDGYYNRQQVESPTNDREIFVREKRSHLLKCVIT
jgi:hypothetical protein